MALNFPGPYDVRIFYTVSAREHVQKLNVSLASTPDPGDPFSGITATTRVGGTRALDDAVDDWVAVIDNYFNSTDASFVRAELWQYETESFDAHFVTTYDISAPGISAIATVPASQVTWTFRTLEGGVMRVTLLDTQSGVALPDYPPYSSAAQDVADFVTASDNPWLGRDGSYPFANIAVSYGQNEALFRKVYRP